MRILLAFLAIAGALFAQSPFPLSPSPNVAANGWKRVVDAMVARNAFQPATGVTVFPAPAPATGTPCSVPLLEMHIPSSVHFTMQMIAPPTKSVDHMETIVPAPACTGPAR